MNNNERRPSEEKNAPTELDKIKDYLKTTIGEEGLGEITIFNNQQINRPLYHISKNPSITVFTPKVSRRTLNTEDRSVPRISTSTCLVGCLLGYQSTQYDMRERAKIAFSGLYRIYNIPYLYALRPSEKLLEDVELSDEYWLFSWKPETYSFRPSVAGDYIVHRIEHEYTKKGIKNTYHIYVEVKEGSLYLTQDSKLERGYHYVVLNNFTDNYSLKENNEIKVSPVYKEEYYDKVNAAIIKNKKGK